VWSDASLGESTFSEPPGALEQGLLCRVAVGDPQAFWDLWAQYRGWLFQICYARMGRRREDAEDALSEVMQKAREALPREALRIRSLGAWLRRTTVNVCIDLYRRDRTRCQVLNAAKVTSPAQLSDVQSIQCASPASQILASETRGIVTRAIESLPRRLRAAAGLFFLQEETYPAIAEGLRISEQNARKRIQEARNILKQRLDVEFPERRQSRAGSRASQAGSVAAIVDNRPEAASQRRLADAVSRGTPVGAQRTLTAQIRSSPKVRGERKRLDAMSGVSTQPEGGAAELRQGGVIAGPEKQA
jgi:RNA polymerase sigma factor (sigma-70 family)